MWYWYWYPVLINTSPEFTYRIDRLKPRASQFRGPPAKVYNIFTTIIGLSHLCCHSILYFLNNHSVLFLTQLHFISEYCIILNTPHHLRLYWNWLNKVHLHQVSMQIFNGVFFSADPLSLFSFEIPDILEKLVCNTQEPINYSIYIEVPVESKIFYSNNYFVIMSFCVEFVIDKLLLIMLCLFCCDVLHCKLTNKV